MEKLFYGLGVCLKLAEASGKVKQVGERDCLLEFSFRRIQMSLSTHPREEKLQYPGVPCRQTHYRCKGAPWNNHVHLPKQPSHAQSPGMLPFSRGAPRPPCPPPKKTLHPIHPALFALSFPPQLPLSFIFRRPLSASQILVLLPFRTMSAPLPSSHSLLFGPAPGT